MNDFDGVSRQFEKEITEYTVQARSEAISVIDEMRRLIEKGLDPDTRIFVWGREIDIHPKNKNHPEDEGVHQTVMRVLLEEIPTGLEKKKDVGWNNSTSEKVKYHGKSQTGVRLEYSVIPPGCHIEERQVIIEAKPAEPERVEVRRVIICQGPNGETEEVVD